MKHNFMEVHKKDYLGAKKVYAQIEHTLFIVAKGYKYMATLQ